MHVINHLQPHLKTNNSTLQLTIIKAFDLIGQSLHPDHLGATPPYTFKHRDEFLRECIRYINLNPTPEVPPKKGESVPIDKKPSKSKVTLKVFPVNNTKAKTSVLGLNACATLIRLNPPLPRDLEEIVTRVVLQYITLEKEDTPPKPDAPPEEPVDLNLVFENLDLVLMTILSQDKSVACLKRLLKVASKFFVSPIAVHRKRAISTYVRLLKKFIDLVSEMLRNNIKPTDRQIEGIGHNLASMLPRCTDPDPEVRGHAIESIQLLLYIHWLLEKVLQESSEGTPLPDIELRPPKTLNPFTGLRKRMVSLEDQNE